jgi:sulfonate transport system substrate-binding protein
MIRLGGVPEHFNYPWLVALEEGVFDDLEQELEWIEYPTGTGAMTQDLLGNNLDLALLLTEGAIKFIHQNPMYKLIKVYVHSPLVWGVHLPKNTKVKNGEPAPFAISRFGSGSHLMAYVYAQSMGWDLANLKFEVINHLEGLRQAYQEGLDAYFLWEKYTTKPFVDNAEMLRVATCPTPWPCFVLVAHQDYIATNQDQLALLLDGINMCLDNFKQRPNIVQEIAENYQLKSVDVASWMNDVSWDATNTISPNMLRDTMDVLFQLGIIDHTLESSQLISTLTELEQQ